MKWLICGVWCIPLVLYTDGMGSDELGAMFVAWGLCAAGAAVTCELLGVEI